jgi:hypothetical protein
MASEGCHCRGSGDPNSLTLLRKAPRLTNHVVVSTGAASQWIEGLAEHRHRSMDAPESGNTGSISTNTSSGSWDVVFSAPETVFGGANACLEVVGTLQTTCWVWSLSRPRPCVPLKTLQRISRARRELEPVTQRTRITSQLADARGIIYRYSEGRLSQIPQLNLDPPRKKRSLTSMTISYGSTFHSNHYVFRTRYH